MLIDRNIGHYLISEEDTVRQGLEKIDRNEEGIIFCIDDGGAVAGVITDGDLRRWIIKTPQPDFDQPLKSVHKRDFSHGFITDSRDRIASLMTRGITHLPLLDRQKRCVAIARQRREHLEIGSFKIADDQPVFIIAEIGNNHNGSLDLAKRLVDEAIAAGADCVKFQLRDMESLYRNSGDPAGASEDLGTQYTLDLLSRCQLSRQQMYDAFDYCRQRGVLALCTPWDVNSVQALEDYGVPAYKVASADLNNHDLLRRLSETGRPLICSTGMSTEAEIRASIALLKGLGTEFALLHCNSTYPAPFKDINLGFLKTLREMGKCPVGYSSHDRGVNICVAATALGARIIEKHFTLDREMEGSDHRISLLPAEFAEMVVAIRQTEQAMGVCEERRLSQGEIMNREVLGKSLVINCDVKAGAVIEESMIDVRSPGQGLPPYRKGDVVGMIARRNFRAGDVLFETDLGRQVAVGSRSYSFDRPFGIPVRYHDLVTLCRMSNFDLFEFHLSYKDMEEDIGRYFDQPMPHDLLVHAPELFSGDHLLDLCAPDRDYRDHSIAELRRVVEITRGLHAYFPQAPRPRIIINAGGFTLNEPLSPPERRKRYAMILESLAQIDLDGVEIIPQTMPPFPWHFGGQRFQNLFMEPDETVQFCRDHGFRVCLDLSHSKLACTHHNWSFNEFLSKVGPYTAHLHIADASGVDGEGLQIGEGEIDLSAMAEALRRHAPQASFIPEIWQGHKNSGEGFWIALDRLEQYMRPRSEA